MLLQEIMKTTSINNIQVSELSEEEQKAVGIKYGLKVINTKTSESIGANITKGFIITAVNGVPFESIKQFEELLHTDDDDIILYGMYCDGTHAHYYVGDLTF